MSSSTTEWNDLNDIQSGAVRCRGPGAERLAPVSTCWTRRPSPTTRSTPSSGDSPTRATLTGDPRGARALRCPEHPRGPEQPARTRMHGRRRSRAEGSTSPSTSRWSGRARRPRQRGHLRQGDVTVHAIADPDAPVHGDGTHSQEVIAGALAVSPPVHRRRRHGSDPPGHARVPDPGLVRRGDDSRRNEPSSPVSCGQSTPPTRRSTTSPTRTRTTCRWQPCWAWWTQRNVRRSRPSSARARLRSFDTPAGAAFSTRVADLLTAAYTQASAPVEPREYEPAAVTLLAARIALGDSDWESPWSYDDLVAGAERALAEDDDRAPSPEHVSWAVAVRTTQDLGRAAGILNALPEDLATRLRQYAASSLPSPLPSHAQQSPTVLGPVDPVTRTLPHWMLEGRDHDVVRQLPELRWTADPALNPESRAAFGAALRNVVHGFWRANPQCSKRQRRPARPREVDRDRLARQHRRRGVVPRPVREDG